MTGFAGALLFALSVAWLNSHEEQSTMDPPAGKSVTKKDGRRRILIVGAGDAGRQLAQELTKREGDACEIIGFVDDDPDFGSPPGVNIVGPRREIMELVDRHAIDEVIICYAPTWQQKLAEALVSNGNRDLHVRMVPSLYEAMIGKPNFDQIDDIPVINLPRAEGSWAYRKAKRAADITASLLALILSSPLMALAALAIKLSSRGPVFYSQVRVGKGGKDFTIYKLRTMVQNAEARSGPMLSAPSDARVTPLGRFLRFTKLDEVPQFYNVLRGDMSIVGPRPERPIFVSQYMKQIPSYRERSRVLPGITGLAQVHGFYLTTVHTKLRYDLMYVYNQSLLLDLKILLLTVKAVIGNHGR